MHAQLAFDFEDSQVAMPKPTVQNCQPGRLFVTKEVMWVLTFFMTDPKCFACSSDFCYLSSLAQTDAPSITAHGSVQTTLAGI
ncbi:MAG: hypothetical protein IPP57_19900 [Candidatus Obscuribacter sp.]|nr:hypothetical protein [Candidatus Obscuribacter sp.]